MKAYIFKNLFLSYFLKFFLLSRFGLVFLFITLPSLPPGVMLLNRSSTPRDSATDIEKTFQKDAPEREQPNKSVVKTGCIGLHLGHFSDRYHKGLLFTYWTGNGDI